MSGRYRVRQGYLPAGRADLLVHLHEQSEPAPAVLIIGALGVSCSEPRYLMTLLARRLAAGGATVVQYDHPAAGDSTGDPACLSAAELFSAGQQVLDFAATLSGGPVAVVGYGAGNLVAASMLDSAAVQAAVLLAPCLRGWNQDWAASCPPAGPDALIAPAVTTDGTETGDIWRVLYGEPVAPSQPPGPVGVRLLTELAAADWYSGASARRGDLLVISDLPGDLDGLGGDGVEGDGLAGTGLRLFHQATPAQPSWHWNLASRAIVIDAIDDWLGRLARPAPAADAPAAGGTVPRRAGELLTETRDGTATSRAVTVDGDVIFGILRLPGGPAAGQRGPCVIYETGNPGQRVDIHRCGPVLAERLAARGLASFRYDPRGMGTSQGDYQDMTWSRRVADLAAVIDSLDADGLGPIVVLGNSAGGRVGLRAAAQDPRITALVLWGPILAESGEQSEPNLIRVPGGLATEWCGLPLGLRYLRDVRGYDYVAAFAADHTPTCVVFAAQEADQANMQAVLAAAAARAEVTVHTAPGQHGFTWPGLEVAIDRSVRWIEATVRERAGI